MSEQGQHYKTVPGEQHHERAIRLGLNWYAANITKYAERAPHKGQMVEDLIKVLDYTAMWLASPDKATMPFELSQDQRHRIGRAMSRLFKGATPWPQSAQLLVDPTEISHQLEVSSGEATSAYVNQK